MADANPLSFIFGGNTGIPTYQELLRRRAIATAQAARQRKLPTTLGEGLTYLGESVGDRLESNRLSEAERVFGKAEDERLAVPGRQPSPYGPAAPSPAAAAPAPVLDAGSPDPSAGRARIAAADLANRYGTPPEVAQENPTVGAETPLGSPSAEEARWRARTSAPDDNVEAWKHAIGGIESSQDYQAVGVPTKYGRAMGRYGVMEANVPKWTAEALGRPLTPQQFLANDKAQDAVFRHKFGQYVAKYGEEKAARAWYGGEGNINNLDATDAHEKLSVRDYGQDFLKRLRGKRAATEDPTTMSDASPVGGAGDQLALSTRMPPDERPPLPTTLSPRVLQPQQPEPPPEPPPQRLNFDPDQPNPDQPTVTGDIRPMSVRTQIAQAPAGMIPGATAGVPGVAMGPNQPPLPAPPGAPAGRPAVPADLPPSLTPIPPASKQVMQDPGPEPQPPERLDFSPRQRAWMNVINNRNSSDYAKDYAKNQFDMEEKVRTEMSVRQNEAYRDKRERWQQLKTAYDTHVMKAGERDIAQLNARLQAEKQQRDIVVLAPLEEKIKDAESKLKQAEVDAIPDAIAKRKADLNKAHVDYSIAIRTLNKPDTLTHAGTQLERSYDPNTGRYGSYALPPGAPQPEEKAATAEQAKAIEFVLRTRDDLTSLERDNGKALTDKFEAGKTWVPFGANLLHSNEYRKARMAMDNWGAGFMSLVSGAAITPSEAKRQLPAFEPQAGDDPAELAEKTRRRRQFTDAVEAAGGKVTHDTVMKVLKEAGASVFDKEARKPDAIVSGPAEAAALAPGRWFVGHDGVRRQRAVTP